MTAGGTKGSLSKGSFSKGVGQWIGAAEVFDGDGRFCGHGRDERTVVADDGAGSVSVEVSFEGPFALAGNYTIVDGGDHRRYEGPLNHGYAEVLGDGLVTANNYWPDLGLSQRFFLMVLPDNSTQLSVALISRGDRARWTVAGEYRRQVDPGEPTPPAHVPIDPGSVRNDATAGRGEVMFHREGRWVGALTHLDGNLGDPKSDDYTEVVESNGDSVHRSIQGSRFVADHNFISNTDGWSEWCPTGDVVGSASLWGGRARSGQLIHQASGLRVWTRNITTLDGTIRAVVDTWFRGEERIGATFGVLTFEPA